MSEQQETCETCRYYVPCINGNGHCHRYGPIIIAGKGVAARFPLVYEGDFCGEHQPAEKEGEA